MEWYVVKHIYDNKRGDVSPLFKYHKYASTKYHFTDVGTSFERTVAKQKNGATKNVPKKPLGKQGAINRRKKKTGAINVSEGVIFLLFSSA